MKRLLLPILTLAACHHKDMGHESHDSASYEELRETTLGDMTVAWAPTPDPIPFNDYFDVTVTLSQGGSAKPGEAVAIDAQMPAHGHGMTVVPTVTDNGDGSYTGTGLLFAMEGHWQLLVDVGEDQAVFDITCCS